MEPNTTTNTVNNHAALENGDVIFFLNESTSRKGYLLISEAKEFTHSIIDALCKKDRGCVNYIHVDSEELIHL